VGRAEDRLITELVGETDYLATELSLLQQRYSLATEEVTRLRARVAALEAELVERTGQPPRPEPADLPETGPRALREPPVRRRRGRRWHRQAET
jgi:outer membrane protein TolC